MVLEDEQLSQAFSDYMVRVAGRRHRDGTETRLHVFHRIRTHSHREEPTGKALGRRGVDREFIRATTCLKLTKYSFLREQGGTTLAHPVNNRRTRPLQGMSPTPCAAAYQGDTMGVLFASFVLFMATLAGGDVRHESALVSKCTAEQNVDKIDLENSPFLIGPLARCLAINVDYAEIPDIVNGEILRVEEGGVDAFIWEAYAARAAAEHAAKNDEAARADVEAALHNDPNAIGDPWLRTTYRAIDPNGFKNADAILTQRGSTLAAAAAAEDRERVAQWSMLSPDERDVIQQEGGNVDDIAAGLPCHKEVFDSGNTHRATWWYCNADGSYRKAYTFYNHHLESTYVP